MAVKLISVLGDSISTFQDYTPPSGVYYAPTFGSVTGVGSAADCWWMQVIQALGANCCATTPGPGALSASRAVPCRRAVPAASGAYAGTA